LSESINPCVYSLQFLFKSINNSWKYERKCEWVFFFWTQCIYVKSRPKWSSANSTHIVKYISTAEMPRFCNICGRTACRSRSCHLPVHLFTILRLQELFVLYIAVDMLTIDKIFIVIHWWLWHTLSAVAGLCSILVSCKHAVMVELTGW